MMKLADLDLKLGELAEAAEEAASRLDEVGFLRRLHGHDASVFSARPEDVASVRSRCGWLEAPERAERDLPRMSEICDSALADGFERAVLLGMGGSSLFPLVMTRTGPRRAGPALELEVLDSVLPEAVEPHLSSFADPKTLVIAASKSGGTVEVTSLLSLAEAAGAAERTLVITDPGSALERRAEERGYRAVIHGQPDVGGRFSALTPFGLLPAMLAGRSAEELVAGAREMLALCGPEAAVQDSPGAALGAVIGAAAAAGRDLLTPVLGAELDPLVAWIEQLVAESTGKHGVGVWPVPADLDKGVLAASDRLWAAARGSEGGLPEGDASISWETRGVGAEVLRWEVATAAASALLGINPFDEPDGGLAKRLTKDALASLADEGELPWPPADCSEGTVSTRGCGDCGSPGSAVPGFLERAANEGRVLSFLLYVPPSPSNEQAAGDLCGAAERRYGRPAAGAFGPRYLHATGQLHKGGSDRGAHVLLTAARGPKIPLPGQEGVELADLAHAQALADAGALRGRGRPVLHVHVEGPASEALAELQELVG